MKPGHRYRLVDFEDAGFEAALRERGAVATAQAPLDLVFFLVAQPPALGRLPELEGLLRPDGAVWVIRVKGPARTVTDLDIIERAREAGLVDNKIASFSEELAGMRLVIPLSRRAPRGENR